MDGTKIKLYHNLLKFTTMCTFKIIGKTGLITETNDKTIVVCLIENYGDELTIKTEKKEEKKKESVLK